MKTIHSFRRRAVVSLTVALCAWSWQTQAAESCKTQQFCTEVSSFTASVSDFRTSSAGYYRIATATLRLKNKTSHPLALGYVQGSGVVIDDLGNRYAISTNDAHNVRAIGVITPTTYDPKFTLQPGEASDARFQFSWYAGNNPAGKNFQLEVTIREIDAAANNQLKLGREHVVQFRSLTDGVMTAQAHAAPAAPAPQASAPVAPATTATPAAPAAPVEATDACAGRAQCYNAGPFVAQVTQVTTSKIGAYHLVRLNLSFRNVSSEPLILAYQTNSGSMIDEQGNRYSIDTRQPDRVKGIGLVGGGQADPQFILRSGESRSATLEYSRYAGYNAAMNTVFTPDFAIEQLQVLSNQQVRTLREYSINYPGVKPGTLVGDVGADGNPVEAINNVTEAGRKLSEGLKSIFKKKQ